MYNKATDKVGDVEQIKAAREQYGALNGHEQRRLLIDYHRLQNVKKTSDGIR